MPVEESMHNGAGKWQDEGGIAPVGEYISCKRTQRNEKATPLFLPGFKL
jgi:hypothetical protein